MLIYEVLKVCRGKVVWWQRIWAKSSMVRVEGAGGVSSVSRFFFLA